MCRRRCPGGGPKSLRDSAAGRTEVLDKVKALSPLPDGRHVTTQMVANYFEVELEAIRSLVKDNRAELTGNGHRVRTGEQLRPWKDLSSLDKHVGRHLALFTRRSVLNVAMLLRDSVVARQVRTHLLDLEHDSRLPQRPEPVDNSVFHRLGEWLDARVTEAVVQHKARNPVSSVTSGTVQQFVGMAKLAYRADVALLVATAPFTREALLLAARHDVTAVHRGLLEAWNNGTRLRALG